MEVVKVHSSK